MKGSDRRRHRDVSVAEQTKASRLRQGEGPVSGSRRSGPDPKGAWNRGQELFPDRHRESKSERQFPVTLMGPKKRNQSW